MFAMIHGKKWIKANPHGQRKIKDTVFSHNLNWSFPCYERHKACDYTQTKLKFIDLGDNLLAG